MLGAAVAVAVRAALEVESSDLRSVRRAARDSDPVGPAVTTTMSGEQMQELPSSGAALAGFCARNATAAMPAGGEGEISLRGTDSASFTLDGASKALAFGGGQCGARWKLAAGPRGWRSARRPFEKYKLRAGNVEAAGSRAAGGRVRMETMRGMNALHGQGFLFDRQNTWVCAKSVYTMGEGDCSGYADDFTCLHAGILHAVGPRNELGRRRGQPHTP